MIGAIGDEVVLPAVVGGVVALITTLGVEYAAKPHLEARKERILERQTAIRGLSEALVRVGQILVYRTDDELLDGVRDRVAGHAEVVLRRMQEALVAIDLPDDMSDGYYAAAAPVNAIAEAVVRGWPVPAAAWDDADRGSDHLGDYYEWLACPRLRWLKRRRLAASLRAGWSLPEGR